MNIKDYLTEQLLVAGSAKTKPAPSLILVNVMSEFLNLYNKILQKVKSGTVSPVDADLLYELTSAIEVGYSIVQRKYSKHFKKLPK